MNPKFISLHYTINCANNCTGCYLLAQKEDCEEIKQDEWLKLPMVAKKMGVEKIAIAINLIPISEILVFLSKFLSECIKYDILLDITTLVEIGEQLVNNLDLNGIDVLSISIDKEKVSDLNKLDSALKVSENALLKGVKTTNANYLIYKDFDNFNLFEKILTKFNTIHLLFQKPFPYTKDEYYNIIENLQNYDIFIDDRYILDPCILFRLGLVSKCHNCEYLIDINPYGSVSGCAFNHKNSIGKIKEMDDLSALLQNSNVLTISKCQYLEFEQINENNRSESKEFNS